MSCICRTCLSEITSNHYVDINQSELARKQLKLCIPELNLDLVIEPILCMKCVEALNAAYDFKSCCLQTEQRIHAHVETLTIKQNVELGAVLGNNYNVTNSTAMHCGDDVTNDLNTVQDHFRTRHDLEDYNDAKGECYVKSENCSEMSFDDGVEVNYDNLKEERIEIEEHELEFQDCSSSQEHHVDSKEQLKGIKTELDTKSNVVAMQMQNANDALPVLIGTAADNIFLSEPLRSDVCEEHNESLGKNTAKPSVCFCGQLTMEFDQVEEFKGDFNASTSEIKKNVNAANACLIPEKSRERYQKQFHLFNNWRKENGVKDVNEDLIMNYIYEKSLYYKPSSLWAFTSMLKATLLVHEKVDIGKFTKVTSFLKKKSLGYKPKKSANLGRQDLDKFLREAPDDKYLMIKVATIFGVNGACRREELYKLQVNNIEDRGEVVVVNIPDSKTSVPRKFTIIGDGEGFNPLELYRRYASLRPRHVVHSRFFTSYHNGKCSIQPVGIKSFGKFPSMVASFLGLENPECYTGHCYRRSSAALLADAGGD